MSLILSPFWRAVGIIAGMIIGSGMFALPYSVYRSGLEMSAFNAVLAFVAVLAIHLAYGEIVANTSHSHRLPGYVREYIGTKWGRLEFVLQIAAFNAVLVVYAILGGLFLNTFFAGTLESAIEWTAAIFISAGVIFLVGSVGAIGTINFLLTLPLVFGGALLFWYALGNGTTANLTALDGSDPIFSFSVFLFALAGLSVIADTKTLFAQYDKKESGIFLRRAIIAGTSIPFALYCLFVFSTLYLSGNATTTEAINGLQPVIGENAARAAALLGFFAIFTSYLALGYDMRKIYEIDGGISRGFSWALLFLVPPAIFLFGSRDFLNLMSLVGGFFVALDGVFVILILRALRKKETPEERFLPLGSFAQLALIALFILSAFYELIILF